MKRFFGLATLCVALVVPVSLTLALQATLRVFFDTSLCLVLEIVLGSSLLAQRSLYTHVAAVGRALRGTDLADARKAVSHIVGRNTATLDRAGIIRAAIESLAENFSDGIVAPALWMLLFGLPGAVAYKAINTADSMIGHLTPRYKDFGYAAAKLDDMVNLPASRLAALWLTVAAGKQRGAIIRACVTVKRDASKHRSPNAGWPEAAMAGALNVKLGGPRYYGASPDAASFSEPWLGAGQEEVTNADLERALTLYRDACVIQGIFFAALMLYSQL